MFLSILQAGAGHVCLKLPQLSGGRSFSNQLSVTPDVTDQLSELLGKFLMSRRTTNVSSKQGISSVSQDRIFKIGNSA